MGHLLTMIYRLKAPTVKVIVLTTLYCAIAGGLTEWLVDSLRINEYIVGFAPPVLFSIAVLLAFKNTGRITVVRLILMPILMYGIFYGAGEFLAYFPGMLPSAVAGWIRQLLDWLLNSLPGMAAILVIALLLKTRLRTLNVLIAGICSSMAFFLASVIASNSGSFFDIGPIFFLWQTLVGFSLGLANVANNAGVDIPGDSAARVGGEKSYI
jgi:hypothetical protein